MSASTASPEPAPRDRSRQIMAARLCAVLTIAMFSRTGTVHADTIHLRSGEKLIGEIISDEKAKVVIKSRSLGRVEISRDRIERIEMEAPAGTEPVTPKAGQPFVPPPPLSAGASTNAAKGPTNALVGLGRAPSRRDGPSVDWLQLKSGEWLRGRLYGMQNRKVEFESDELEELEFEFKDVYQLILPQALVSYGDRESAWGFVVVDREKITVTGVETVQFPRFDVVGIAPGRPREWDYWSGRINVGLNLRSGNTEQSDLVTKVKIERRTPVTHLKLEYVGNFSEVNGEETVNNRHVTEAFDIFLTRRLFVRVPYAEYYHDPFQNIESRITAGGGLGYYVIDTPKTEWLIAGGPGYQVIRFESVEPGESPKRSTPALILMSTYDVEVTKRIDFELGYQAIVANADSGGITHHGTATLEIDLTQRLDLDISLIWDRIGNPQADETGVVPVKDDFRLNLSLGVKF